MKTSLRKKGKGKLKNKNLALITGIVSLTLGDLLVLLPLILRHTAADFFFSSAYENSLFCPYIMVAKIVCLILAIIGLILYSDRTIVPIAAHILIIIGGVLGTFMYFDWITAIFFIIGGALYLSSLNKFETNID